MKKKWLNVLASVVCATAMLLSPTIAWAEPGETVWTGTASDKTPGTFTTTSGSTSTSIDVEASVENAGDKIRYSVKITYGAMQFMYDYGQVWDPESHTYIPGSSGLQKGGWVISYLDGENNRISVTNNSNYPITVNFLYTPLKPTGVYSGNYFNSSPTGKNAVVGIFTKNNEDLVNVNTADYQGNNATNVNNTLTTPTVNLDWDYQNLEGVQYDNYGKLKNDGEKGVSSVDMFFSLCGIPDAGCTLAKESIANGGAASSVSKVGKITVTVSPYKGDDIEKPSTP